MLIFLNGGPDCKCHGHCHMPVISNYYFLCRNVQCFKNYYSVLDLNIFK